MKTKIHDMMPPCPWPRPKTVYDSFGPSGPIPAFDVLNVVFDVFETEVINAIGNRAYHVVCHFCGEVHAATTAPWQRIEEHITDKHTVDILVPIEGADEKDCQKPLVIVDRGYWIDFTSEHFKGAVKWDGCMNWSTRNSEHACGDIDTDDPAIQEFFDELKAIFQACAKILREKEKKR